MMKYGKHVWCCFAQGSVAVLLSGLLNACSEGGASADLHDALSTNTNLPSKAVDCMATLAEKELSSEGMALLAASLQKDEAQMAALRAEMSFAELTAAGMFMVGAAGRCGAELED